MKKVVNLAKKIKLPMGTTELTGTSFLKQDLGETILSNLRKQNIIASNIENLPKEEITKVFKDKRTVLGNLTKYSDKELKDISKIVGKKTLKKSALKGAAKALRFVPGLGLLATAGFGAYGLYDAIKKGYTDPAELLASAAWGSGVEFKDKEEKKKEGIASLKV